MSKHSWIWQLVITLGTSIGLIAFAWGQIASNAVALSGRVAHTEKSVESLKDERTQILVAITAVEERLKAIQVQIEMYSSGMNLRRPPTRTNNVQP